ncbi:MFS transporter [Alteromonas lipolytica]|uniref:Major facilitator superfamily (MFS) profile domain-containing protein n=1 Tax=Alteromonas lipolytica TaxID=1856405 RepID=A0A1E8F9U2_9ALTE|nr:MFS transporter [Alteromonas lipolytica]OFI32388.1 hypothetical protein BFC17_06630 [Alteromonas lipolytica]GGF80227.1 MFS transporter [Alteromonas lipolytica]
MEASSGKRYTTGHLLNTIVIAGLEVAGLAGARLVLILIALSMGASTAFVGILAAMFTLFPTVLNIAFGRWVDRVGTFIPMLVACSLAVIAGSLYLLAQTPWMLALIAGLVGVSAFFSSMVASRSVGSVASGNERTRLIGYLVLGYSVFGLIGPLILSATYEHGGDGWVMVVLAGFGLLALLLMASGRHYYHNGQPVEVKTTQKHRTTDLLKLPSLRRWVGINAVFASAQTLFPVVISLLSVEIKLSPFYAGLMLSGFAAGMTGSRLAIGVLVRYMRPELLILLSLIFASLMYVLLPFVHESTWLLICCTLLGIPLGMALPLSISLIYENAPENRISESVALSYTVTGAFQTLTPLVLGVAAGIAGTQLIALVIAGSLAIAALSIMSSVRHVTA